MTPAAGRAARRPPPLPEGGRIRVVAPASSTSRARIDAGRRRLEALGFSVAVAPQAYDRAGRYAGSDRRRAAALLAALRDPHADAVFFVRGGFGAARVLPLVERELAALAPKIVVGYSDATSLLAWLTTRLGWVAFHGPMVATDFPTLRPADARELFAVLAGELPRPLPAPVTLRGGRAEGRLLGGCLSILVSLLGTPYAPDLDDSILFLEDVNEEPYQLDRMMTQLRQSGALERVRAVAFAEMARCGRRHELLATLDERTRDLGLPVVFGVPSGHGRGKRTVPLGVRARLDTRRGTIEILESATATRGAARKMSEIRAAK